MQAARASPLREYSDRPKIGGVEDKKLQSPLIHWTDKFADYFTRETFFHIRLTCTFLI